MAAKTGQKTGKIDLNFRHVDSFRAATANEESRTVEATISTETPVEMYDFDRWEVVPEVLLSDGMRISASNQVPLLDSHSRHSTSMQLGSVRNVTQEGDVVRAELAFSSVNQDEFTKVREGHVTDVSVGYRVLQKKYLKPGETKRVRGKEFTGPINVVTEWRLLEVSLTPIGADEQAKLRGFDPSVLPDFHGSFEMNEELRKLLVAAGMPAEHNDDQAQRWLIDNPGALAPQPAASGEGQQRAIGGDGASADGGLTADSVRQMITDAVIKAESERAAKQQQFRSEVDGLLEVAGLDIDASQRQRFYGMSDIAAVRTAIVDQRAAQQQQVGHSTTITFGPAQRDKHESAVRTALLMRCVNSCDPTGDYGSNERRKATVDRIFPEAERSKDWAQFRHASLFDIAQECLRMDGVDVRGHSRDEIAMAALGFGEQVGIRMEAGYHTTGSFPNITRDAINKSMMLGYGEYPATWRGPMRQGESVADFKKIHRMQLGAVPNLPIWNDSKDPDQASMADEEETYAVECRSLALTFNYKLLVNDDMSVISRSPFKLGDAAARTVNASAWAQITGNPTMRDSVALFATATGARKRTNLTTGAGTPSATTIQTLTNLMMQMRGSNTPEGNEGPDILGLMPRYIVVPSALRTTALQVVRSIADPNGTHAGVVNVNNDLIPVVEPSLDANSSTAWYLFAEPTRVETVEVTFLQGQETPRTRMITDQKKLSQEYIILQTFAAKALDHRGVQKHAGA